MQLVHVEDPKGDGVVAGNSLGAGVLGEVEVVEGRNYHLLHNNFGFESC